MAATVLRANEANARAESGPPAEAPTATATVRRAEPPRSASEVQRYANLDRLLHAFQARLTASISPAAVQAARMDWWAHFLNAPGLQLALGQKAAVDAFRLGLYALRAATA